MRSGRGSADFPGAEVEANAAINRTARAYAPGMAIAMLEYKAAEAGAAFTATTAGDHATRAGRELRAVAIKGRKARRKLRKERDDAA